MTHARFLCTTLWVASLAAGLAWSGDLFAAATVKGTVQLPAELKAGRRYFGHWRVENTNVALPPANLRGGTVVLLTGLPYQVVPPKTVSVEISGVQAKPATVVVSAGTVVEFKNSDKVAYDLSTPAHPQVMPPQLLGAGSIRKQRFGSEGEYLVRCSEYPHIIVAVIVTNTPFFGVVDDRGAFRISDVPIGHATLKVWSGDRWVKEAEVDVPARGLDLTVRVPSTSGAVDTPDPTKESAE
jgi:plastocyanin